MESPEPRPLPPQGPPAAGGPAAGEPGAPPPGEAPSAGYQAPAPQPPNPRSTAMLAHLSALVGLLVGVSLLGPLIVWLVKRDEDPFVDFHGKEALNFNLSVLIYGAVGGIVAFVLTLVTLGLALFLIVPVFIAFFIAWIVLVIVAAVKASSGEWYRYPLTLRLVT